MFIQTLSSDWKFGPSQKWEPAGHIGDFENFLTVSLKAHACFDRLEY